MDVRLAGVLVHLVLCRNFLHIFPSDFKSKDLDFTLHSVRLAGVLGLRLLCGDFTFWGFVWPFNLV